MNLRYLKPLRVGLALFFFAATAFLFLDIWDLGLKFHANELLFLQFVPSLIQFIHHPAAGAAGFILVLVLTFIFGRIYCAAICPLGIFQDTLSRISPWFKGKKNRKYGYSQPRTFLRYGLLGLTILTFVLGANLVLNLLDPFSSFGRIITSLAHPLVILGNNLAVPLAESFGSHALFRVNLQVLAPVTMAVASATLVLVAWMSSKHGRLYCNTICPVGTLLGLVSKFSLIKIGIGANACTGCGQCQRACKGGCIDVKTKNVDIDRCVACFNCLGICPENALIYGTGRAWTQTDCLEGGLDTSSQDRRNFILALAAGSLGLAGKNVRAALPENFKARPTTIPENKTSPVCPPGAVSIERYTAMCTACHLCVSACPSGLLVPSVFAFGLSNMMQPQMDFHAGHCNFDCTVCANICPSGAILPLTKEKKQRIQVGVAKFIKESCVVYTDNTNCGACSEHCPTKAVDMVPYINTEGRQLVIPKMNEAICVGCGGCEYACPTRPYKAIFVDGNPVHKRAEKPVLEKLEIDITEDFPF